MSYFARVDKDNIVQSVCVVNDEHLLNEHGQEEEAFGIAFLNKLHGYGFTWIQTSYNTRGGLQYAPNSNEPDGGIALRKNYAGIGYTYDKTRDAFIAPKPYPSWELNEDTCRWNAPTPYPDDGKIYIWDEDTTSWVER